ncbi:MAG TPA: DUF4411 family protein [Castellaniella sp.]|uniref:DUF4411 family protein n=1 Tax=Castellaniella sp. TaxID=1955812 RepID=UPI002EE67BE0
MCRTERPPGCSNKHPETLSRGRLSHHQRDATNPKVHALAGNHVVVTHETLSNSQGRIKIPNACLGIGVSFMTPYQMLRREKARFVLGRHI